MSDFLRSDVMIAFAVMAAVTVASRLGGYWLMGYVFGNNNAALNSWSYNSHGVFFGGRTLFGPCNRNELFLLSSYGTSFFVQRCSP